MDSICVRSGIEHEPDRPHPAGATIKALSAHPSRPRPYGRVGLILVRGGGMGYDGGRFLVGGMSYLFFR